MNELASFRDSWVPVSNQAIPLLKDLTFNLLLQKLDKIFNESLEETKLALQKKSS